MKIIDLIVMCARNLFRRKVRTILTVMGVVIGTASIVVMMSLGVGLNSNFEAGIDSYMDVTAITVTRMEQSEKGKKVQLNDKALEKIAKLDHVETATPLMSLTGMATITCGRYSYSGEIVALDLNAMEMLGYETTEGSLMQNNAPKNGIYFGYGSDYSFVDTNSGEMPEYEMDDTYHYIDPPPVDVMTSPLSISVNKNNNDQTGVSSSSDQGSAGSEINSSAGDDNSDKSKEEDSSGVSQPLTALGKLKEDYTKEGAVWSVIIPLELGQQLQNEYNAVNGIKFDGNKYNSIKVKVDDLENVSGVEEAIKEMGFQTESAQEFRDAMSKQAGLIQVVLGGLGAISLFVAALGITNTMIMSIYERTREIGVMKVLGCRLRDIRLMFLMEAGGIGFIGGVIGITFSYILSFIVNTVVGSMDSMDLYMKISIIPFWLVLLGMSFAVGVGLIAGFSPANRAVKISPLSAIRQE